MENKNIAGIFFIILSIGIYFVGTSFYDAQPVVCDGWNTINPVCWGAKFSTSVFNFIIDFMFLAFAIWTAGVGIMIVGMDSSKFGYIVALWIFLPLFILNIFIPDPIPVIDEIILGVLTAIIGIKVISQETTQKVIGF